MNIYTLGKPENATKILRSITIYNLRSLLISMFARQCSYNLPEIPFKSPLNLHEITHEQMLGEGCCILQSLPPCLYLLIEKWNLSHSFVMRKREKNFQARHEHYMHIVFNVGYDMLGLGSKLC